VVVVIVIGTDIFQHLQDSACRCSSQWAIFITSKTETFNDVRKLLCQK
jgi:hypothetical protein